MYVYCMCTWKKALIGFALIPPQSSVNVSVDGPQNCTGLHPCWQEGDTVWTTQNLTLQTNIQKCTVGQIPSLLL